MGSGALAIVLHAHLPYVRHPEYEQFLEERWLFEALTETYIPLLRNFDALQREGVPFRVTVSISPSLLSMLEDPLLQERYDLHLQRLIALAEREQERAVEDARLVRLAAMYRELFVTARDYFQRHHGRLAMAFDRLHRAGVVRLITTAATHGILPLLMVQPSAVAAQIHTGFDYFESVFGFRPEGMWLPECAYAPGLDPILREHGVRYFILESHGIENASVAPLGGVHAPVFTPCGVAAFGRDQGSTKEVWSAEQGFPGDPDYREFYRDIGFDLDQHYLQDVLGLDVRAMTGIKYHRITGPTNDKQLYDPEAGRARADQHAGVFLDKRIAHFRHLTDTAEVAPIIVAPFDAELFGHWWFEGPQWLDLFIRKAAYDQDAFTLSTLGEYLDQHPVQQSGVPGTSTWGHAGYFDTWLSGKTDWIFDHLVDGADRLQRVASRVAREAALPPMKTDTQVTLASRPVASAGAVGDELVDRALRQAVRELLLAQSSDWTFIISNGTSAQYAERRVRDHIARLHWLLGAIEDGNIDEERLAAIEYLDRLFPDVQWRHFVGEVGGEGESG